MSTIDETPAESAGQPELSPRDAAKRRRAAEIFPPRSTQNVFPNGRWTIPEGGAK